MVGIPRLLRRLPHDVLRLRRRRTAPGKPPTGYVDVYADATGALAGVDDTGAALSIGGGTPTSIANAGGSMAVNGSGNVIGLAAGGGEIAAIGGGAAMFGSGWSSVQANADDSASMYGGPSGGAHVDISAAGGVLIQPVSGQDWKLVNVPTSDPSVSDAMWLDGGVLVKSGSTSGGGGWQLVYDHTVPMGGEDTWAIPLPAGDLRGVRYVLHFPTGGSGAAELAIDGVHVTELDPLLSQAGTWCLELLAIGAGVATGTVWYFQETGGASFFGPFGHQQGAALTTLDLTSFDASTPLVAADLPEDTTIEVWALLA